MPPRDHELGARARANEGDAMSAGIDKVRRVPLREVWKHEALDFTAWLRENVDVLNDPLGLSLVSAEREQSVGSFSVDLVAESANGDPVVIENQLERSNHDHLGKVLTYLVNVGADTAVWIVSDPRPEHVKAVAWLNESTNASIYMVKVEAIRIGDSPAAPLLTLIVGPSPESRAVGETKRDLAERHEFRYRFWSGLLEMAKKRTRLHANISPGHETWVGASAGRSGISWNYVIHQHDSAIELYIDPGPGWEENVAILRHLESHKDSVEAAFGRPLIWEAREGRRSCRVRAELEGGYRDEEQWPEIQSALIDAMVRLEKALAGPLRDALR